MEPSYSDKQLMVAIVAQELADIDPHTLKFGAWAPILAQATRKLAYWLEQPVDSGWLYEAQEALSDLTLLTTVETPDELWHEFEMGVRSNESFEDAIDRIKDGFDDAYEAAVLAILGVKPRG